MRADRHQDFALAQDGSWAVALDLELDDDLRQEGTARELVRAVNDLRKSVGLELSDRITLVVGGADVDDRGSEPASGLDRGRGARDVVHRRRHRHRPRGALTSTSTATTVSVRMTKA